ncbi:putative lipoprotein YerB [Clostridia bacterium]|nr:putative lipoprotein YerB [Clostridia bacterium]
MKKRVFWILLCILATMVLLPGCGKKKAPEPEPVAETTPEPEPEPELPKDPVGKARSYTTGQWIDEAVAKQRPYAVMIGNTVDALPQYGISKADIIYEVPVEGGLTRLMAIFQDTSGLDKIGSNRSCRHYFIFFALEFDAIYAHFGQSAYAVPILAREDVDNISGMDSSVQSSFYRDKNRKSPHNAFTSDEGLKAATAKKGYRTTYNDSYKGHYLFAPEENEVNLSSGADALLVKPGYLVDKPWFVYHPEDGLYYRYEYKKEQVDAGADNAKLAVKNILVQYCTWRNADKNGYLDIDTVGEGSGKYITNGKVIDVTWKKASEKEPARYYNEAGLEITLNQGKTWVCIQQDNLKDKFAVYQSEEERNAAVD